MVATARFTFELSWFISLLKSLTFQQCEHEMATRLVPVFHI